jgi:hypothetical protein
MDLVRIAAGVAAAAAAAPAGAAARKSDDPGREICKSRSVVGSRLQRVRECHSAEQWEDLKLQEQVGLMRKQFNGDPGCNGGGASCHPLGGRDTPW